MYFNNEVEKLGAKPYAFIPQRNNIVMKYMNYLKPLQI